MRSVTGITVTIDSGIYGFCKIGASFNGLGGGAETGKVLGKGGGLRRGQSGREAADVVVRQPVLQCAITAAGAARNCL